MLCWKLQQFIEEWNFWVLGYKYSESHSLNDSLKNNQKGSKSIAVLSKTFRMNLPVSELSSEDLRDSSLL